MLSEEGWQELRHHLPVGKVVRGKVLDHQPFGFFVRLEGLPEVNAIVLAPDFLPGGVKYFDSEHWPQVGALVTAAVSYHVDVTQQVRLIVT